MKRRRSPSSSPEGRPRKEKNAFEVDPANARPEEKLIAEIMKMTKENLNKTTVRDSEMFLSDVFRLVRVFFGEVGYMLPRSAALPVVVSCLPQECNGSIAP